MLFIETFLQTFVQEHFFNGCCLTPKSALEDTPYVYLFRQDL